MSATRLSSIITATGGCNKAFFEAGNCLYDLIVVLLGIVVGKIIFDGRIVISDNFELHSTFMVHEGLILPGLTVMRFVRFFVWLQWAM
jgi:hypothetical protein